MSNNETELEKLQDKARTLRRSAEDNRMYAQLGVAFLAIGGATVKIHENVNNYDGRAINFGMALTAAAGGLAVAGICSLNAMRDGQQAAALEGVLAAHELAQSDRQPHLEEEPLDL